MVETVTVEANLTEVGLPDSLGELPPIIDDSSRSAVESSLGVTPPHRVSASSSPLSHRQFAELFQKLKLEKPVGSRKASLVSYYGQRMDIIDWCFANISNISAISWRDQIYY